MIQLSMAEDATLIRSGLPQGPACLIDILLGVVNVLLKFAYEPPMWRGVLDGFAIR